MSKSLTATATPGFSNTVARVAANRARKRYRMSSDGSRKRATDCVKGYTLRAPALHKSADESHTSARGGGTIARHGPIASTVHIVHADAALIAVDKPAGMLAVPGRGEAKQDCAAVRARARFGDALVVHRLDMATS